MKVSSMIPTRVPHVRGVAQALLLAIATAATAAGPMDQEATVDGYTVRWNAAVTGFLPRSMVEKHHLDSTGRDALNVGILEPMEDGKPGDTLVHPRQACGPFRIPAIHGRAAMGRGPIAGSRSAAT